MHQQGSVPGACAHLSFFFFFFRCDLVAQKDSEEACARKAIIGIEVMKACKQLFPARSVQVPNNMQKVRRNILAKLHFQYNNQIAGYFSMFTRMPQILFIASTLNISVAVNCNTVL